MSIIAGAGDSPPKYNDEELVVPPPEFPNVLAALKSFNSVHEVPSQNSVFAEFPPPGDAFPPKIILLV